MDKFVIAIGSLFVVLASVLLFVILGTLFGAVGGWIVGLFFGDTILTIFAMLGIKGVTMFQIGAFLGFVGGYFRTTSAEKADK